MDSSEATKVVIKRISSLEPEHVAKKIIGYMYFQELSDQEMIRLALGPDTLIHNLIQKAKTARLLASSQVTSPPISPTIINPDPSFQFAPFQSVSPRPFPSPPAFRRMEPYWDPQLPVEQPAMQNAPFYPDYIGLEDPLDVVVKPNDYYFHEAALNSLSGRGGSSSSNLMDFPVKTCHYFIKGICKHGSNCRYYHGELFPESHPHASFGLSSYDLAGDEGFLPGSLEKLELEISELLKSRRGHPVSIASLPMLYYDKYGKTLQAEGYLTESQRHGKAGYSLTKLLARLRNSIRLIDRPHGQHAVILAEDAAKYMDIRAERNDPGPIVSGSRQIYLTFPAESTFTEEDVSDYFSNYGQVQDVRIPCQQKRMFGFVTFVTADTVRLILSKGNPHYVRGARVLVKPYREKAKLVERKYLENFDHPIFFQPHPADIDSDFLTGSSRLFPRELMEEQERVIELEATHLSQLQLASRQFNDLLDVLPLGGDQESSSQGVGLPDSPFASAVGSSISAVI
ncbi:hypothetical protein SASPL_130430 [Salvia splendens]|uniref:Zinc finger CCCH domain-containing protein 18-like n=1 Tax=Salvia splendens TaxID=180675 RepID=A0A8X8X7B9_SALSN|nr:zinc finger CCCH domain-containing protein 18-like isoform X1 [Salvia splendens]KAG6407439.1 hypothetical protein SASPL_130430 [Salvia splendens]